MADSQVAMLLAAFISTLALVASGAASPVKRAAPQGIDVSGTYLFTLLSSPYASRYADYQPSVNWATVKANGVSFAYIKATEGTSKPLSISMPRQSR